MTNMRVIGLTGGIGMGKSTVAAQMAHMGAKICNADSIVHRLLAKNGKAVAGVQKYFPSVVKNNTVDRKALGVIVFGDKAKLKQLEDILHPLVVAEENRFMQKARRLGARLVVFDIPLLFETGGERRCELTFVVSAPSFIQRQRVLARPGMTDEKFQRIVRLQMPDGEKRRRADIVIATGLGRAHSYRQLKSWAVLAELERSVAHAA